MGTRLEPTSSGWLAKGVNGLPSLAHPIQPIHLVTESALSRAQPRHVRWKVVLLIYSYVCLEQTLFTPTPSASLAFQFPTPHPPLLATQTTTEQAPPKPPSWKTLPSTLIDSYPMASCLKTEGPIVVHATQRASPVVSPRRMRSTPSP